MEEILFIGLIVIPLILIVSVIIFCFKDNSTSSSNGFHTGHNRTRYYSESKYRWEDVSNDDFDDSDDVVWGREDY